MSAQPVPVAPLIVKTVPTWALAGGGAAKFRVVGFPATILTMFAVRGVWVVSKLFEKVGGATTSILADVCDGGNPLMGIVLNGLEPVCVVLTVGTILV